MTKNQRFLPKIKIVFKAIEKLDGYLNDNNYYYLKFLASIKLMSQIETTHKQVQDLYLDHHGWLQQWLKRKLGCSNRAADLAHDTFIRLFNSNQLDEINEPRAFLTTIASRVLSSHWRREKLEQAYLSALAQQPENYAISPEEQTILLETLFEIDQALAGLPVIVKRTFFLAQLDNLKYAEIAAQLDISVSTVKRYLIRASAKCYFALELAE